MKRTIWASVTVGLAALMTFGCGNVFDSSNGTNENIQQQPSSSQTVGNPFKIWAVDTNGALFSFFSDNPGAITAKATITGLPANEKIVALDCRPRTGVLYGITGTGKLFWIAKDTAVATLVGAGAVPPQAGADIDFNPTVDVIRQEAGAQNVRVRATDGTVAVTDTDLTLQPANVPANSVALAYTNPDEAPTTTQLFVISAATNRVYLQANPNDGKLTEVAQLPVNIGTNVGFDIAPGNIGFAAVQKLSDTGFSTLVKFDPANSTATAESAIGGGVPVKSIAVDLSGPSLVRFVGIDSDKNLVRFNSNDPTTLLSSTVITGVAETIVGCDFSPGGNAGSGLKVLAVPAGGGLGKIYSVDVNTAVGTLVSTTTVALPDPATKFFGVDIQPGAAGGVMVITAATGTFAANTRVISGNSTQVFRTTVSTGATVTDPVINGSFIPAIGVTDNFLGSGTNSLFGVNLGSANGVPFDQAVSIAVTQGTFAALGFLSQLTTEISEMDIEANNNLWFVGQRFDLRTNAAPVESFSTLFRIGRPSFGASTVARVGGAKPIKSFAIIPAFTATLLTAP